MTTGGSGGVGVAVGTGVDVGGGGGSTALLGMIGKKSTLFEVALSTLKIPVAVDVGVANICDTTEGLAPMVPL